VATTSSLFEQLFSHQATTPAISSLTGSLVPQAPRHYDYIEEHQGYARHLHYGVGLYVEKFNLEQLIDVVNRGSPQHHEDQTAANA
jgi:hypothetical protein